MPEKQSSQSQQVPSVGRVVHFTLSNGEHRPALIVRIYEQADNPTDPPVNLRVFLDKYDNVSISEEQPTSVQQGTLPGTWHWPEYVAAVQS